MYAIAFDLDQAALEANYALSAPSAYSNVRKFLEAHHFSNQQGSVYYGDTTVTMVTAITVVTEMAKNMPRLESCISDIRILQLMNNDDLMPAIKLGASMSPKPVSGSTAAQAVAAK
jgi:virulence-associated protein VapD